MKINENVTVKARTEIHNSSLPANPQINQNDNEVEDLVDKQSDKLTISNDGLNLYKDSIKADASSLEVMNIEAEEVKQSKGSSDPLLQWAFIDSAIGFRNELEQIEASDRSVEEKEQLLNQLESIYLDSIGESIDDIVESFDQYFDQGRAILDFYSEDPVEDLFDADSFKNHLLSMVSDSWYSILSASEPQDSETIYSNLIGDSTQTSQLEKMSFRDMELLSEYMSQSFVVDESITIEKVGHGSYLAHEEHLKNKWIESSGFSYVVKNAMYEVNNRISEGAMRKEAFAEEFRMYNDQIKEFDIALLLLLKRLKNIGVRIDAIRENNGITPENKRLLVWLKNKNEITNQYNQLREAKAQAEKEFNQLNSNKHKIVEKDSYKLIKFGYEETMRELS